MAITGSIEINGVNITVVDADPVGLDLPLGSIIIWINGSTATQYTKIGTGLTASDYGQTATSIDLSDYQVILISGTNIKTINSQSLLGSGDISISGSVADGDKGDIIVSSSGAVWTLDNGVIGIAKLSATGTANSGTYLRGDNTWSAIAGGTDFNIDKTLVYTGDKLTSLTSAVGSMTFNYTGDQLTSITGTGAYKSKTLNYTGDQLTNIDVA